MSDAVVKTSEPARAIEGPVKRFMRQTEIDTRLLGMIGALLLIWIGFHVYGAVVNGYGAFLTPRNLWNLSVQTASIAVMATGMVLVIVTRNIDLSVGSVLGFTAMIMGVTQVEILPKFLGLGHPAIWIIAVIVGLCIGAAIGAMQGFIIAYLEVPSFIVTLGGLLVWRGGAWWVARGQTIAPVDATFKMIGGGPHGSVGATISWVIGIVACLGIIAMIFAGRRQRIRFGFPLRPIWAEMVIGALGCGIVLGAVLVANAYPWPIGIVRRYAEAHHITIPDGGLFISHGFAIPVLLAIAVGVVMTFLATRTKFGRYVFAIGGNPEAAELAGINTRRVTMMVFVVMGMLCAISGVISSARLDSATNSLGTLDELYVIAATVIGGTSFAGGLGTVYGAMLGAVVMQSLQSGMVLIGVESAIQQMVVGGVLVLAVFIDTLYRKRSR
jgi:D-xylose transport system permease protein